jgi:hypothetical protein
VQSAQLFQSIELAGVLVLAGMPFELYGEEFSTERQVNAL